MITTVIHIGAEMVEKIGSNLFAIHLPARDLSPEEHRAIGSLFPNLSEQAYKLLSKEALLEALVGEEQVAEARRNGSVKVVKDRATATIGTPPPYKS